MTTKTLPLLTLCHELTLRYRGARITRIRSWDGNIPVKPEWARPIARIYLSEASDDTAPKIVINLDNGVLLGVDPNLDTDPNSLHGRAIVEISNGGTIEGLGGFSEIYSLTDFSKHGRCPAIYLD